VNDLVIRETDLGKALDARELWEHMESRQQFADWIKGRIDTLRMAEGRDFLTFQTVLKRKEGARGADVRKDYVISVEMAKHIALMENTDRGFEIRDRLIRLEEAVIAGIMPSRPPRILPLAEHTKKPVQVEMSKAVNGTMFEAGGRIACVEYNTDNCIAHTGRSPREWKEIGKQRGLKAKDRTSGKAVVRVVAPEKACCMSLADNIVTEGHAPEKAFVVSKKFEAGFKELVALGVRPAELDAK